MHQSDQLHRDRESGSRCHPRFWQNSIGREMNKIYVLKLGTTTKFENLVAKHPF